MENIFYFFKGRVALYALLKAFDIKKGDIILLPGYTCVVVAQAIKYLDAIPEYADIDLKSYNVPLNNYQQLYNRLKKENLHNRIKAVIIQHTYGNPNKDTEKIVDWSKKNNWFVIEDCAHVNGVKIYNKLTGSFGDASFFSTQWNKPFTTGIGGYAIVNNKKYLNKMKQLENDTIKPNVLESLMLLFQLIIYKIFIHPKIFWTAKRLLNVLAGLKLFVGSSYRTELEDSNEIPTNYFKGMGKTQKKILLKELKKMDKINSYRKLLVIEYEKLLKEYNIPLFNYNKGAVLIKYPILVNNRDQCLKDAKKKKIELGEWFNYPLHPSNCNIAGLNWNNNKCPNALTASNNMINLPLHKRIKIKKLRKTVSFVAKYT